MSKNIGRGICKECRYRFRRVFIPLNPENYLDDAGDRVLSSDDNIFINNRCLLIDMDIDEEETIECSHFSREMEEKGKGNHRHGGHRINHIKIICVQARLVRR